MSNIEETNPTLDSSNNNSSIKNLTKNLFESVELMSLQKGKSGLDLNSLSNGQKDKVIELMSKNEDNAYDYHVKKLASEEKLKLKQIEANSYSQVTSRQIITLSIIALVVITAIVLIFKETFFIPWLTFLTGIAGGYGLSKVPKNDNTVIIEEDDE